MSRVHRKVRLCAHLFRIRGRHL